MARVAATLELAAHLAEGADVVEEAERVRLEGGHIAAGAAQIDPGELLVQTLQTQLHRHGIYSQSRHKRHKQRPDTDT